MHLCAEVGVADGVEVVDPYREELAKVAPALSAEDRPRLRPHEQVEGNVDVLRVSLKAQQDAVLRGYQLEVPCRVGHGFWQVRSFLDPLPAPHPGLEVWLTAERLRRGAGEQALEASAGHNPRFLARGVGVVVRELDDIALVALVNGPVNIERAAIPFRGIAIVPVARRKRLPGGVKVERDVGQGPELPACPISSSARHS